MTEATILYHQQVGTTNGVTSISSFSFSLLYDCLLAYCYEFPSGIEDTIMKVMGVTTAEYDLLFSVSAWPSIILCLIGGILVDRLVGLRLGLLIVVSSVLPGQIIWAIGGFTDKFLLCLLVIFLLEQGMS